MSERKKNLLVNGLIILCMACTVLIDGFICCEYHRLDTVMPANVVLAILAPFTGELLIICLRQVLGSDIVTQAKGNKTIFEEETKI